MKQGTDFASLAGALLHQADGLLAQWLPGGVVRGHEYVCASIAGGAGRSLSVNLKTGQWADFSADLKGGDLISLYGAIHGLNNGQAARELAAQLGFDSSIPAPPPGLTPGHAAAKRKSMWRPVVPVPEHAPPPDFKHWHYTAPHATWAYRRDGVLYGHVVRFTTGDGGKEVLPLTWCVDEGDNRGTMRWHWKQWEEPRPLYLAAGALRGLPVVLVEGEKCAQAGHALLGDVFDFVSWPGGSKAWNKCDWSWLAGATVMLWPDADSKRVPLTPAERDGGTDPESKPYFPARKQPGMAAMVGIGTILQATQRCSVTICPIPAPGQVADGWDIADAIVEGWDAARVRAFLESAKPFVVDDGAAARDVGQARASSSGLATAGAGHDDRAWRAHLLTNDKGAIKAVRENVVLAMEGLPQIGVAGASGGGGVIGFNEFTNDVIKLRDAPWNSPAGAWSEVDELKMGEWLVRHHHMPSMPRGALEESVRVIAFNNRFHPVRQYLQGLRWDGVARLETWLMRACMDEDEWDIQRNRLHAYLARVGTWFIQGMCARVMQPGVKFDWMLILEGRQGMRKSTLLHTLAGDYFADTGLVLGDKDSYQQLQGRWLYEFAELDSFGKAEVTKIKSFVASASDYFRASFDRRARDYPRQVVFGGSTNEDHYLTDPTGNRRFWPVRVEKVVDIDWVSSVRDQLFAEAMVRVAKGKRMYPSPDEERDLFEPQQQLRAVENAIEVSIGRYFYDNTDGQIISETTLVELLGKIGIGVEKLGPGRYHEKQAAAALRRLGWEEGRSSRPGRPRVYRRPGAGEAGASLRNGPTRAQEPEGAESDCPF
ncbi:MAG: hypothetical protein HKL99_15360 [Burkholderiales bacterium]|nr:hypothetical protein [Burkholderiales bacterium]